MDRLNLGCGDYYVDGWVNVDVTQNERVTPDVVADITGGIPFDDDSFDRVYLGHVLEHLPVELVVPVLADVRRVLRSDGRACIVGPDVALTLQGWNHILGVVLKGADRWDGDVHLWNATGEAHYFAALAAGFEASLVPIGEASDEWPIPDRSSWQFAVELA